MNCVRDRCAQGRLPCPTPYECWTRAGGATIDDGMPVQMLDHEDEDGIGWEWAATKFSLMAALCVSIAAIVVALLMPGGFFHQFLRNFFQ